MVTIKDLSKKLGVSPATISKALNGYPDISQDTAERIRQAAKEMHYTPNIAARQLKTNTSHNIGVLFVDERRCGLTHEYFSQILNSAKEELEQLGYDITFISPNVAGIRASFLEHARYRNCDGVLIASVDFENPAVRDLVQSEIPTVTIDYQYENHSAVMSDNVEGMYGLTRYLLEKGHRRIAMIHGEQTLVTRKRLNGFYRAMKEFNAPIPESYVVSGIYHDSGTSAKATRFLMGLPEPPTAIMYQDDFAYLGGLTELERMGKSVPGDVSVTGYDGILLARCLRPKLTTWFQDTEQLGRISARKLVEEIEDKGRSVAEQIMVRGKLIEGGTVKAIPAGS